MPQRSEIAPATEASLIPNIPVDLTPLVLDDDEVHTLTFPTLLVGMVLLAKADGAFHWSRVGLGPSQESHISYESGVRHSLPVRGLTGLDFVRASGEGTVTIKFKLLATN